MTDYSINDTSGIITPAYVVFRDIAADNLRKMIEIAGDVGRLRPHCKTHKMAAVAKMQLEMGITKHKCATLAEAQMLADAGVRDILLAYNIVGANIPRAVAFAAHYPHVNFMVTADHAAPVAALSAAAHGAGVRIGVMLDLDSGMHRTGIAPGEEAMAIYRRLAASPGLEAAGLHAYDGHHHEHDVDERRANIDREFQRVLEFRDELLAAGLPVPRIVTSGTPGFPIHAAREDATIEVSPGTTVFYDAGSAANFPDLPFTPAALVLTRVISRPAEDLVTFDVGSKAIAADPPMERRCVFPALPDAEVVIQNEEHLVLRTAKAGDFLPGDEQLVIPWHVCPTSALHKEAYVVWGGELVDRWAVTARDRWLTI